MKKWLTWLLALTVLLSVSSGVKAADSAVVNCTAK